MEASIIGVFCAIAIVIMCLGLLIALCVVVFKDAKAHHMNPWGWTALVLFVPNFIGLIIYLVVRSNMEKEHSCSNCKEIVKKDYNLCPNCQAVFERTCPFCKRAVDGEHPYCPYCGQKVEDLAIHPTASKVTNKTNIVKPLAIIGGTYLVLMILAFVTMFTLAAADGAFEELKIANNISVMNVENNSSRRMKASFGYKNDRKHLTIKKEAGEQLVIHVDVSLDKGSLLLTVSDSNGNIIETKDYTGNTNEDTLILPIELSGKYKVKIDVKEASGKYDIRVEK